MVDHFLKQQSDENPLPVFTAEAFALLQQYDWPGNVRELRNTVERACVFFSSKPVMARDIAKLVQSDISSAIHGKPVQFEAVQPEPAQVAPRRKLQTPFAQTMSSLQNQQASEVVDLNAHLQSEERRIIQNALDASHGVVSRAARSINIKRTTFIDKMHKYHIGKPLEGAAALCGAKPPF